MTRLCQGSQDEFLNLTQSGLGFTMNIQLMCFLYISRDNGLKCYNQREPLAYFRRQPHLPEQLFVLRGVLRRMRFPVYLQDITVMSALRRDGHPSVYVRALTEEEAQHPEGHSTDCSHWCLPGVPDAWNEMLYALL